MNMTIDQLLYVLQRKYTGIRPGIDFILTGTIEPDINEPTGTRNNKDASIFQWNLTNIEQPSEQELQRLWSILEQQYHSEPARPDSELFKFTNFRNYSANPNITINEDL